MIYEYIDLSLILISILLSGLALHRVNRQNARIDKIEKLIIANIKNPKFSRNLLKEHEQ
jgi:hypothetical protein